MFVYVLIRETEGYDGSIGTNNMFTNSSKLKGVYASLDKCQKAVEKIAIADAAYEYWGYDKDAKFIWNEEKMVYSARSENKGTDILGNNYCDYTKTFYTIYKKEVF